MKIRVKFIDTSYDKDVCGRIRHFFARLGLVPHKTIRTTLGEELKKTFNKYYDDFDL